MWFPQHETRRVIGLVTFAICLSAVASNARAAQAGQVSGLAAEVGQKLAQKKVQSVAVCPFRSLHLRDGSLALGTVLSDQFTAALSAILPGTRVFTRADLIALARRYGLLPIDVERLSVCGIVADNLHASVVVTGDLSFKNKGRSVEIGVTARQRPYWVLADTTRLVPMDAQMRSLREQPVYDRAAGVYLPGTGGVSFPAIQHCHARLPTTVNSGTYAVILYNITAQGAPAGFLEMGRLGKGVKSALLANLRTCSFHPARLRNGTPVAARMEMVIDTRLMP